MKFLFLPAEHDPDSFIRANGEAAFAQCVKDAVPLSRFLIEAAGADCDLTSAEGRARMASQARPLWSALPDGALKRQLIGELSTGIGIGSADLLQLWQQAGGSRAPRSAGTAPAPPSHDAGYDGGTSYESSGSAYESSAGSYRSDSGSGSGKKGYSKWRKGPPPPPRMLGTRRAGGSRADRAVGLLLANAQAWDSLSADDHSLLAHLPAPHGPLFAWLEAQLHEHGAQPWAALREALRGHEHEVFACTQVEQVPPSDDPASELSELSDVMNRLRRDGLEAQARLLAEGVARGDAGAMDDYKRVSAQLAALKASAAA